MELVFVRHGEGEHTEKPDRLHTLHPALTLRGESQARELQGTWPLSSEDLLIVSPTLRTLQTAERWSESIPCRRVVSPALGPRMFPQKKEWKTLPCDRTLRKDQVWADFPGFQLTDEQWEEGINEIPEKEFEDVASELIHWCKQQGKDRVFVVTHDGTMTAYKQWLDGKTLTRKDFPKETGWIRVKV
ncbi:histidine phosphatase family protein [Halobacillus litoralis]|uniref:Histidine phosphatase family protein n=1 Tax=Halobacillus litoralis TaxID=45668 RepID=A0A845E5U1_9BACI|nr:histidine phosphatase family protein [Halobacillus litoralis]MYL50063.1 histidine phosphatase family protein [Halobacillus litoralis]